MLFPDVIKAQASGGAFKAGIFFRLDTTVPLRLWAGFGDCNPGANYLDPDGAVYSGAGELKDFPPLKSLSGGKAQRLDFQLSGVSSRAFQLVDASHEEVPGKLVNVGFVSFDDNWQLVSGPFWGWFGKADMVSLRRERTNRTVSLSVASLFAGRARAPLSNYTDADQRARSADDRFCERTGYYARDIFKIWPD